MTMAFRSEANYKQSEFERMSNRRRGFTAWKLLERRCHAKVATEIWRRAARMVMACLPRLPDEEDCEPDDGVLGKAEPPSTIAV